MCLQFDLFDRVCCGIWFISDILRPDFTRSIQQALDFYSAYYMLNCFVLLLPLFLDVSLTLRSAHSWLVWAYLVPYCRQSFNIFSRPKLPDAAAVQITIFGAKSALAINTHSTEQHLTTITFIAPHCGSGRPFGVGTHILTVQYGPEQAGNHKTHVFLCYLPHITKRLHSELLEYGQFM